MAISIEAGVGVFPTPPESLIKPGKPQAKEKIRPVVIPKLEHIVPLGDGNLRPMVKGK